MIPSLEGGGAEKVFILLLRYINRKQINPVLVLFKKEGIFLNQVPKDIRVIILGVNRTRNASFKIIRVIRKESPDICFTSLTHLNLLISLILFFFKKYLSRKTYFIAQEVTFVQISIRLKMIYSLLAKYLIRYTYRKLDKVICLSISMRDDLYNNFKIPLSKLIIIYNPVPPIQRRNLKRPVLLKDSDKSVFLAVGRIDKWKRFNLILKAFASISNKKAELVILGKGILRSDLEKLANELNIQNKVHFLGFQDPLPYMYHGKALLIASEYEGMSNVLIEANACGIPVLAFDAPGVSEFIQNDLNGWIIDRGNMNLYTEYIDKLANNELKIDKDFIRESIKPYELKNIVEEYAKLFLSYKEKK